MNAGRLIGQLTRSNGMTFVRLREHPHAGRFRFSSPPSDQDRLFERDPHVRRSLNLLDRKVELQARDLNLRRAARRRDPNMGGRRPAVRWSVRPLYDNASTAPQILRSALTNLTDDEEGVALRAPRKASSKSHRSLAMLPPRAVSWDAIPE